ncbi:antitoxin [Aureimonas endophytica]|uniref:Antitoxin n=1 Tax=Aureimonas endophytica TaxID=2027858 RepID=A0A916ZSV5_9HYPH|nr:antitoxin [Aureimonas endophytica]
MSVPSAIAEPQNLSSDETMRLARVWTLALEVWRSEVEARDFLLRPHAMLADRRPIDVILASEGGAEAVLGCLGRLCHGSAA